LESDHGHALGQRSRDSHRLDRDGRAAERTARGQEGEDKGPGRIASTSEHFFGSDIQLIDSLARCKALSIGKRAQAQLAPEMMAQARSTAEARATCDLLDR